MTPEEFFEFNFQNAEKSENISREAHGIFENLMPFDKKALIKTVFLSKNTKDTFEEKLFEYLYDGNRKEVILRLIAKSDDRLRPSDENVFSISSDEKIAASSISSNLKRALEETDGGIIMGVCVKDIEKNKHYIIIKNK